ncbi:Annexin [Hortaea werneckii]|nr:Annexin [Hortaea werneckii]
MSLRPDDHRSSRSRSKSATRDRSRSRSNVRAPEGSSSSASHGYRSSKAQTSTDTTVPGSLSKSAVPSYEVKIPQGGTARSTYFPSTSGPLSQPPLPANLPYPVDSGGWTAGAYQDLPPSGRSGYIQPTAQFPSWPEEDDDDLAYGDSSAIKQKAAWHPSLDGAPVQYPDEGAYNSSSAAYKYTPKAVNGNGRSTSYSYQYAPTPDRITYTATPQNGAPPLDYKRSPRPVEQLSRTYTPDKAVRSSNGAEIREVRPNEGMRDRKSSSSKVHRLSLNTQQQGLQPPPSPGLGPRPNRLSVSGGDRPDLSAGYMPPPSPLLEAYHGTYQSLSPMPSAMKLDDDLSDLELQSSQGSRDGRTSKDKLARDAERGKEKKRVVLYDAEGDATKIAKALSHHKIDSDPIIDILPGLSHDDMWALRKEYKKQVKIQGKGINLPKHLKVKLAGNFGKAAYVTALGRWESEGYWANFWYQSHGSRRELLIESLMGRTNLEIRNIKDEFNDKRYADDLVRCMEQELKMDKFRTAVLMALEERRQEDQDVFPVEYRNRDVQVLYQALNAKQGGESAMLEIIVRRSDAHLRDVLRMYESTYRENFARAALRKSNNLVGEVIAHILNGVINKPVRDAMLLQHAIQDIMDKNKEDDLRYELLISRLVRLHWDKVHLVRVKRAYKEKQGRELQEDIEDATKGDFREFMCELAEAR